MGSKMQNFLGALRQTRTAPQPSKLPHQIYFCPFQSLGDMISRVLIPLEHRLLMCTTAHLLLQTINELLVSELVGGGGRVIPMPLPTANFGMGSLQYITHHM